MSLVAGRRTKLDVWPGRTPLTVPEARAILRADEALDLTFEDRLAAGTTFSDDEREAWMRIVESATERVAQYDGHTQRIGE